MLINTFIKKKNIIHPPQKKSVVISCFVAISNVWLNTRQQTLMSASVSVCCKM